MNNIENFQLTYKRTWAEIDLDAIKSNFKKIKKLSNGKKVCCVIKANAYGHGAVQLAQVYQKLGADLFAVANIEEAVELRNNKIDKDILILGYTPPICAKLLHDYNLSQCVYSFSYGKALHDMAEKTNVKVKIHIKIDTGMGRIGFLCLDEKKHGLKNAIRVCNMKNFNVEGIFTHFALADNGENGKEFTMSQYSKFLFAKKFLIDYGISFKYSHCSNSAGILNFSGLEENTVRAGIVLYGMYPSNNIISQVNFTPAMTLKSIVINVKDIEKGQSVGYGRKFIAGQKTRIATIPIGYADGFFRADYFDNRQVLINGQSAPVVGKVCMDQIMVDVTNISCHVNSEVVIFGKQKGFTPDDIAQNLKTISYEITCAVGLRVPRIYLENGKIVG